MNQRLENKNDKSLSFNPNYPGGKRTIWKATKFAISGFMHAFKVDAAVRQELAIIIISCIASFFIASSWVEGILLILPSFLLIITELLNSAIESVVDRIGLEKHPLSKIAKDVSASAVLVATLFLAIVWISKIITLIIPILRYHLI